MHSLEFLVVDTEVVYRVLLLYNSLVGGHRNMSYTLFLLIFPPHTLP